MAWNNKCVNKNSHANSFGSLPGLVSFGSQF